MSSRLRSLRVNLGNLKPAQGSLHKQKRVGRGQGSHHGGTAGKGHNGQNSRSGPGPHASFEGGQTPITRLFPKRGFKNRSAKTYAPVNLDRIQHWIDQGRLTSSPEKPITARELLHTGCIHDVHDGIKILGDGADLFKTKIYITPSRASKTAIKAIEKHGGKVVCKYYNPLALRDCVKGRTDRIEAAPTRRSDILWYGSWLNRGYLAPKVLSDLRINEVDETGRRKVLPFAQPSILRWQLLSAELSKWKKQQFDRQKKL